MSGQAIWDARIFTDGLRRIEREGVERGFRKAILELCEEQLESWPALERAVDALDRMNTRDVLLDGRILRLQNNPARIKNIEASMNTDDAARRPCPLCPEHMPPEQRGLPFMGDWMAVCNPLPLFRQHIVMVHREHKPQTANKILPAMLEFTRLTGFTTLYNGPRCGASIPDHLHLQASPPGWLPMEDQLPEMEGWETFVDHRLPCRIYLAAENTIQAEVMFKRTLQALDPFKMNEGDSEPGMNIAVVAGNDERPPLVVVHPRFKHRPHSFYADGDEKRIVSPGAADMAGLLILPRLEDFERLDQRDIHSIFKEVCLDGNDLKAVEEKL